jgi:hypothetical protein
MRYINLAEMHREDAGGPWDETSYQGQRFRRRFRVPYQIFEDLCIEYAKIDPRGDMDRYGRPCCALRLLVLGVLRVLGTATTFDVIEEATDISFQTHNAFFKQFVKWVSTSMFEKYIHLPRNVDEVMHVQDYYDRLGLPGCTGSVDCVHWAWDMCPAGLYSDCKGKEGFPTVVFQVIVTHTRFIQAVSKIFYGTWNDITITHHDNNLNVIQTGELSQYTWIREQTDGPPVTETGLYLICDGGYPKRPLLICPFKDQQEGTDMHAWSSHVESLRKDVECTFGILKKRFMILKHAVRFHDIENLEHIFRTCCIFHNILLTHDWRDDWESLLDDDSDSDVDYDSSNDDLPDYRAPIGHTSFARGENRSHQEREAADGNEAFVDETASEAFMARRENLIDHYVTLSLRRKIDLSIR